jgi:hypothetical protein
LSEKINLTWPESDDRPWRILNSERVCYPIEHEVLKNGKKVIEQTRVEFMVATARPATEAELQQWKDQP